MTKKPSLTTAQVGGMPGKGYGASANVRRWDTIAESLRAHPGEPILLPEFTATDKVEALQIQVNYEDCPVALRDLGGAVKAFIRNSQVVVKDNGKKGRRGDLWLLWLPAGYEMPGAVE